MSPSTPHPSCCTCDNCGCGGGCPCTETLCRCEASSVLNSLSLAVASNSSPSSVTTTTTTTRTNHAGASTSSSAAALVLPFLVEYKVQGMKCSSCVRKIQQLVRKGSPTDAAMVSVDLTRGLVMARVSSRDQAEILMRQIEQLGFEAVELLDVTEDRPDQEQVQPSNSADASLQPLRYDSNLALSSPSKASPVLTSLNLPTRKQPHRVEMVVGGMTCTMCSKAVTMALQKVPGVEQVSVSLATNLATIDYNDTTSVSDIAEAIENVGYAVEQVLKGTSGDADDEEQQAAAANIMGSNASTPESRFQILQHRQEQQVRRRKYEFLWSLMATLPILSLTMILPHVLPSDHPIQIWLDNTWTFFQHDFQRESFILWLLATPVQFVCGWTFYQRAYYNILNNQLGMDVLVVLGTTASYGYALFGTIGYGNTKTHHDHQHDHGAHFFETSSVLICFVLLGKWMNALAVRRTSDALTHLMQLQAKTAIRVIPGKSSNATTSTSPNQDWNPTNDSYDEQVVPIETVQSGDIVKVIRGASIPADGVVLYGEMTVDESMITGESVPVLKTKGSMVLGGTICVETATTLIADDTEASLAPSSSVGAAFCVVTGVGSSTALAQIVQLVQEAQTRQVPIQNFADSISAIFVPTVATISVVTFLVWYALCNTGVVPEAWYTNLQETTATFSLMFGVACLVISCPCALGLATPTAVMVGTGVGARHGVLLKGGEALEKASKVNSVVFDKTGTLTKGKPEITNYHRLVPLPINMSNDALVQDDDSDVGGSRDDDLLLWLMASLERNSEHPLATAVVAYVNERISPEYLTTFPFAQPSNFRALTGRGASGTITMVPSQAASTKAGGTAPDVVKVDIAIGNRAFCTLMKIAVPKAAEDRMTKLEDEGKTAILATVNSQVCAVIGIADELKPDAGAAISYLRDKLSIDVWMVTGDNARTANAIARRLNLPPDRVISEALPVAKVQQVLRLQSSGRIVAMVGDGVNDSPALAQADVGMSLGTGAEIAAEASDMVLVRGHVKDVCIALNLSQVIFRRIQWNFLWALVYNCLGIPVAAGVLFPLIHTRLPPTVAALAMALSSLSVVSSSLALRFYKPPNIAEDCHLSQRRPSTLQTTLNWLLPKSGRATTSQSGEQQDLTLRLLENDYGDNEDHQASLDRAILKLEEGLSVPAAST